MQKKALVIIDIQNDITKNYKDIIDNINKAVDWATGHDIHVVYIRHENLSDGTRTFKPNTRGSELAPDLKMASKNVFTKYKGNALSSEAFADFIRKNEICDFYIAGADAVACVKSTCYNLRKANYSVTVLGDIALRNLLTQLQHWPYAAVVPIFFLIYSTAPTKR
jgi:nicotinamidase-related amidase